MFVYSRSHDHRGELEIMSVHQASKSTMFRKPTRTKRNIELREREYLTKKEIDILLKTASKNSRNTLRDQTLITVMFRHGLRVSEACYLKWEQIDLKEGVMHVKRLKNGNDSVHPIPGVELRLLSRMYREKKNDRYVFLSERKSPISKQRAHRIIKQIGECAGFAFSIHPHMLRHSCGYHLVNQGTNLRTIQLYLGHKNIQHTTLYTRLDKGAFADIWAD